MRHFHYPLENSPVGVESESKLLNGHHPELDAEAYELQSDEGEDITSTPNHNKVDLELAGRSGSRPRTPRLGHDGTRR